MAKLIHILAASVGSGLVLGASIRLGEALGSSSTSARGRRKGGGNSVPAPEWQGALSGVIERMERQQDEMEVLRSRLDRQAPVQVAQSPGIDVHRQISEEIDRRLAAVEEKLQLRLETSNEDAVNAMVSSIEKRLAPRIERLEAEIGDQSAAVAELRDCSLQSERSIQRLLTVLERTMSPKGRGGEGGSGLSVMSGRAQDDPGVRRPATLR